MKQNNKHYESPKAEVIEIENQGVLCASAPVASTNAGGGTTNMDINTGNGWE